MTSQKRWNLRQQTKCAGPKKAGYHYGWDWGPRIVTSGIWKPVYLVGWNDAKIDNIHYIQSNVSAKKADIKARATVIADKEGDVTLTITAEGIKNTWHKTHAGKKMESMSLKQT